MELSQLERLTGMIRACMAGFVILIQIWPLNTGRDGRKLTLQEDWKVHSFSSQNGFWKMRKFGMQDWRMNFCQDFSPKQ